MEYIHLYTMIVDWLFQLIIKNIICLIGFIRLKKDCLFDYNVYFPIFNDFYLIKIGIKIICDCSGNALHAWMNLISRIK